MRHVAEIAAGLIDGAADTPARRRFASPVLSRLRAGWRPDKAELIAGLESLDEVEGYRQGLAHSGRAPDPAEALALVARERALRRGR